LNPRGGNTGNSNRANVQHAENPYGQRIPQSRARLWVPNYESGLSCGLQI
jgi:hypothetical protein